MAQSEQARNPAAFKALMEEKLGRHLDWSQPNLQNYVGPYDPKVFEEYELYRSEVVGLCGEKLSSFSNTDFLILAHSNFDDPNDVRSEWRSFARDEIGKLNKACPPWFAGGFGHPEYAADFEYWAQNRLSVVRVFGTKGGLS
ncbi:MAG: hypothetical protein R8G34_07830 [Paracoccaceae bacterium]|nr:hypothetical protein [Paracoccaceae bacterium]